MQFIPQTSAGSLPYGFHLESETGLHLKKKKKNNIVLYFWIHMLTPEELRRLNITDVSSTINGVNRWEIQTWMEKLKWIASFKSWQC